MKSNLRFKIFHSFPRQKKSLMVRENELWISSRLMDNSHTFEREINSNDHIKTAKAIKYKSIKTFKINPSDNRIEIDYVTILKKNKKEAFTFSSSAEANLIKDLLANELNFERRERKESILRPLIKFGAPIGLIILFVLMMYLAGPVEDYDPKGPNVLMKKLIIFLHTSIGIQGITILGVLASSFFGYLLTKRIMNPTNEIVYVN